jgi:hypothetical protein
MSSTEKKCRKSVVFEIDTKSIELGIQYVPTSAIVAWLVSYSAPIACGAVRRSVVSQAEGK